MWNGSDYELHRGTVILEDLYLEHNLSFLPSTHLLPFSVLKMDIGTMGPWAVLGLVGRGHVPQQSCSESREHTQLLKFPVPHSLPFSIN